MLPTENSIQQLGDNASIKLLSNREAVGQLRFMSFLQCRM